MIVTIIIVFPDLEGNCSPIKSFDNALTIILTRNNAENSREFHRYKKNVNCC